MDPFNLKGLKLHHVGVAVHSIEKTAQIYENLGYFLSGETKFDPIQNVRACFYCKNGFPTIELIEAVDETSPMSKILKKNGAGPYHFCYGVDDIGESIKILRANRFLPVSKVVPATGMPGKNICFMYNQNFGLIELVEN